MKLLSVIGILLFCGHGSATYMFPPTDHHGADLWLGDDGDVIWGEHINIGTLTIPTSTTVYVPQSYDGSPQGTATLRAQHVILNGTLTATEAGYEGGFGGFYDIFLGYYMEGDGGAGPFGGNPIMHPPDSGCPDSWCGGYRGCGTNGDTSNDDEVDRGSGGSGTNGPTNTGYTEGDYGGTGGGSIKVIASQSFIAGPEARVFANGGIYKDKYNSGAGGGVLIDTRHAKTVTLAHGFQIQSLGGGVDPVNGGTVKLFIPQDVTIDDTTVSAGRGMRDDGKSSLSLEVKDVRYKNFGGVVQALLKATGRYSNLTSSESTNLSYEFWMVDNTSGKSDGGVLLRSGTISRIKGGKAFRKVFKQRLDYQLTGKYLLWKFPGTYHYALAGPLP